MVLFAAITMQTIYVQAQQDPYALLRQIRDANANKPVSYDYKVCKRIVQTGKTLDCISGKLYQQAGDYLDSNNYYLSSVRKGYYCKLDFKERSAIVFNADVFRKEMGMEANGSSGMIAFPDSIIKKYGQLTVLQGGQGNYLIELKIGAPYHVASILDVDKSTLLMRSVKLVNKSASEGSDATEQVYEMKRFNYAFDIRVMDHNRFYKVQADKSILMTGIFTKFKLNTLTK